MTEQETPYQMDCWECSRRDAHAQPGGLHPPFWCKPDACPERGKHYEQVFGGRVASRSGAMSRDGVATIRLLDGEPAEKVCTITRCICGLLLIWTPKANENHPSQVEP